MNRLRVGVYGYFGMGNIGNEGTLTAFLAGLRAHRPDADVLCLAAGPDEVSRDHGVAAVQLMAFRPRGARGGGTLLVRKVLSRVVDMPRTWWLVGRVDVMVIPGTGVLETTLLVQPWSLPYWTFLTAVACRLRRRRLALVSVGAELAPDRLTRYFHRWTVRLAHYVSYRDEASREAMTAVRAGRSDAAVYPDLAFALPAPAGAPERPDLVVLGVMRYETASDGALRGATSVRSYADAMTRLVGGLVDEGRSVRFVVGDIADRDLAREIEARAVADDGERGKRVSVSMAETLEDVMDEMAGAGVVVASRFHNVICALIVGVPTVSLGYAGKNARLLDAFGLGELSQPMDAVDVGLLAEQIRAARSLSEARARMRTRLAEYREALRDQDRRLWTEVFGPSSDS